MKRTLPGINAAVSEEDSALAQALKSVGDIRRRFTLATDSARIGIWEWDVVTNKLTWDARMYSLYGLNEHEFSGAYEAWRSGVHPLDRSRCDSEIAAAIEGVKEFHTEFRVVWPSGEVRDIEAHGLVERAADGSAACMTGANWDITDRKRAETRVRRLHRVQAVLSAINSLIVRVQSRDQLFGDACEIAVAQGQFEIAWIGIVDHATETITPVASAGQDPQFLEAIEDRFTLREPAPLSGKTKAARAVREGKTYVLNAIEGDTTMIFAVEQRERGIRSMAVLPLLIAGQAVGALSLYSGESGFFDAEEIKLLEELAGDIAFAIDHIEKQKRLDYLAYYDALTGLANRNLFRDRIAQYMQGAASGDGRFALFLIDLERFRNINHSLGHSAGDSLLKQVGQWLISNLPNASLLARLGVDQFAAVLPEVRLEDDAARLVEKTLVAFLEHPFRLNDAELRVAAKVGVVLFPEDGTDIDTLFKNAEAALRKAKVSGSRFLRYTRKMTEAQAGKLTLESQLRQALEKGEFVLHYQPKVNVGSGKVTSAEALIRWNDPRTGLVAPAQFIPLLEETGLILEVGRWVLNKAIEDHLRWRDAGLSNIRIAVNVSPLQLRQHGFIAELERAIGVDAHAAQGLELELTESLIMEDIKHSVSSLQAIRAMNIKVAVDDFGTGFSSLSYLAKLPVDSLKIDRAFVNDMTGGPPGLALVTTIINLAHSLKLTIVAEGVETDEQSNLLRLLSCDEIQGYLIGKPAPADVFSSRFLHTTECPSRVKPALEAPRPAGRNH